MSENPKHFRHAPARTRSFAAIGVVLITAGVWWLEGFRSAAMSRQAPNVFATFLPFGFVLLAAGIGCAIHVIYAEMRRMRAAGMFGPLLGRTADAAWPIANGVQWIALDGDVCARLRRAPWVNLLFVPSLAAGVVLIKRLEAGSRLQWIFGVAYGVVLVSVMVFIAWHVRMTRRMQALRIGTDGIHFWFDPGHGNAMKVPLNTVRVSGSHVLIGARILSLVDGWRRPIFPLEPVRGYILARLPAESFVGPLRMYVTSMMRGSPSMIATTVVILTMTAIMAIMELQPSAVRAFVKHSAQWLLSK